LGGPLPPFLAGLCPLALEIFPAFSGFALEKLDLFIGLRPPFGFMINQKYRK